MAVAMVAMLAFGGTYAYFTASAGAAIESGSVTTGHVELGLGSNKTITKFANDYAVPGDTLWDISIDVDNKSNVKTYIFADWTLTNTDGLVLETTASTWTAVPGHANAFYVEAAANTDQTFTTKIVLATSNDNTKMDKTISCSVSFKSIQFDHFDDAQAAYEAWKADGSVAA